MDSYAFASLAHVRILLLPVGIIQRPTFEKCVAEIRSFDEIRLGDIPADTRGERVRFMPKPLSTGYLHLSFPTHPPPQSHGPLSIFRPSHFPLGVIGVATCSESESLTSILAQFNAAVLEVFPPGSLFPLAKSCFVFEDSDGNTNMNLGDSLPGLVVIPSIMGNKKLYIGTLLADLCSNILGEFGHVVTTLESPLGNEHLNSSLLPVLPPLSEIPPSLEGRSKPDSLPPLPSYNSQPELSKVNSFHHGTTPLSLQRNSSSGPGFSPSASINVRQSSLGVPTTRKRQSGIGVASSHGRLFKVLADFFLLSGRTEDAALWYAEAILLLKLPQDAIWHASALEGLATISVLDAWSAGHGLHNSISTSREPWSDVSDKLNQAIPLYYKASPMSDAEHSKSSLFFSVWSAKGWGPLAFTSMLHPGPGPYLPPTISREGNSWLDLERLSTVTGISRSMIAATVSQGHGPWLLHLGSSDRVAVLEAIAGIYGCLGYRRKEAYVLREVLGCVMDLLVCAREEDSSTRRFSTGMSSAGPEIQDDESSNTSQINGKGMVGMRQNESTDGNESVLKLLKYICEVLGIDLEAVKLVEATPQVAISDDSKHSPTDPEQETDLLYSTAELYGWPELQVGVVREALAVAEALPDYLSVAQFALSSLKTLHPVLSTGDQVHLYSTSSRALATARRRGDTKSVDYWSGRPIVSIAVSPLPSIRLPNEKPISALKPRLSDMTPILTGSADPFLYNPRKSTGRGQNLVVQNELLELVVTLQNSFVFDLELQSLALSTSGVAFESKAVSVVIPSNSFHPVTIVGKALEAGLLVIRGCIVQAPGGVSREFVLPLSTDEEEDRQNKRRSAVECEVGRSKYSGLDSRAWTKPEKRISDQPSLSVKKISRFLECKVIPEQPLLRIRRTSLTHGALMLYNGEMSTIRLTLENISSLPIDFLRLSFEDSTMAPAQQALADGELSVFETYETEYDLIHQPVFTWNAQKETTEIGPGSETVVTVICFGKVGCANGIIHVSYSSVRRSQPTLQTPSEHFYTRQLSYPVLVTVYHMLECHDMDILPYTNIPSDDSDVESRKLLLQVDQDTGWCLFSIDVRNTYGLPFEVTFERKQEGTPHATTTTVVPPGSTSRIIIPIKKFLLPDDRVSEIIPTLSDRQFVITKSNLTPVEDAAQRELFWYREELFRIVRGHWRESGGIRGGDLSLRQERMTLPMLETLRTETAQVDMSLVTYDPDNPESEPETVVCKGGKYYPRSNEFIYLLTKVTNLTRECCIVGHPTIVEVLVRADSEHVLTIGLDMEPLDQIIYEGVLSDIPVGRLQSGQTRVIETAICFLSNGRFELNAEVRLAGVSRRDRRAGGGKLEAVVKGD